MDRGDFPPGFVFGSATAAYQVEGAVQEGGRGPSIWDTFAAVPGAIADGTTGAVADDQYHRYAEDTDLMARLGFDAYRFSIAWPRIQPDGTGRANPAGLDYYRRLCDTLLDRGITPWVTLYHWDLPEALEQRGGWLERDTAHRFADYAGQVAEALGDRVQHWITLNEPWCAAFLGYASGYHAPGRQVGSRAAHAAHHLLLGHGLAVPAVRAGAGGSVGITLNLYSVRAASESAADQDAARRIDGLQNRLFLDPVLCGDYPADVLADVGEEAWFAAHATAEDRAVIAAPLDFLGINYYSRHTTRAGRDSGAATSFPGAAHVEMIDTGAPRTAMGWEIHPDGLVDVLHQAHRRAPGLPLYITENGSAYHDLVGPDGSVDDPERLDYLRAHLSACRDALDRGLPLAGYFVWSLLDNFEWAWGHSRRFGVVHVDYPTQTRTVKSSGRWLAGFLRP